LEKFEKRLLEEVRASIFARLLGKMLSESAEGATLLQPGAIAPGTAANPYARQAAERRSRA